LCVPGGVGLGGPFACVSCSALRRWSWFFSRPVARARRCDGSVARFCRQMDARGARRVVVRDEAAEPAPLRRRAALARRPRTAAASPRERPAVAWRAATFPPAIRTATGCRRTRSSGGCTSLKDAPSCPDVVPNQGTPCELANGTDCVSNLCGLHVSCERGVWTWQIKRDPSCDLP
jgi:hypothetical protein